MTTCYPLTGLINMSVFSERLKLLRSARNITQTRLAELVEADPQGL
jgi:DNA-binding XRE family transcriptional regulator